MVGFLFALGIVASTAQAPSLEWVSIPEIKAQVLAPPNWTLHHVRKIPPTFLLTPDKTYGTRRRYDTGLKVVVEKLAPPRTTDEAMRRRDEWLKAGKAIKPAFVEETGVLHSFGCIVTVQ